MNGTDYYRASAQEVMRKLDVSQQGLTDYEVRLRHKKYGYNELQEGEKKNAFQVFLDQFQDFLVIILISDSILQLLHLNEDQNQIVVDHPS
mgnify:CR=1 FL=1